MRAALIASVCIVVGSPYVGQIRGVIQTSFPGHYRTIVGGTVGIAIAAAVAFGLTHIRRWRRDRPEAPTSRRHRSAVRYGLMAAALISGAAYARAVASGNPDVDVVEAFHFVEYGTVTYLFYRAWRHRPDVTAILFPLCAAMLVGLADEAVQWFVPGRVGELHDVLLNVAAISCALLFSMAIHPPASLAPPQPGGPAAALGAALAGLLVVLAVFVDRVHFGYEIRDGHGVTFRSQFAAGALARLTVERAEAWRTSPPPERGWAKEDRYLSEGLWHVQQRNLAETRRDFWAAWNENLILERFYAPVLDRGARWAPEQRDQVAHVTQDARPREYLSAAEPYPIYLVSRAIFWPAIAAVGAALLWTSTRGRPRTHRI